MKTKAAIQKHAIRLFREQGYQETTVEQIAEASEISPSTFFRYFPTKEAVVLEDDFDPLLIQVFQEQPANLPPLQALRQTIRQVFSQIPQEDLLEVQERMELSFRVPEIRAASLSQMSGTMQMIAELVAARAGRDPDDFQALTIAGALVGAVMSVQAYSARHPGSDFAGLLDAALAHLEAGLSFDEVD